MQTNDRNSLFSGVVLLLLAGILATAGFLWQSFVDFTVSDTSAVEVFRKLGDQPPDLPAGPGRDGRLVICFAVSPGELMKFLETVLPRMRAIARQASRTLELDLAEDDRDVVRRVETGAADLGSVGAVTYAKTRKAGTIKALLEQAGSGEKHSCFVVKADHPATTLQDLKGGRIAYKARDSLSGYRIPLMEMRQLGIDPAQFFAAEVFTGNLKNSLTSIQTGELDCAVVSSTFLDELEPEFRARFKVLLQSRPLPGGVYIVSASASADLTTKLVDEFQRLGAWGGPVGEMSAYFQTRTPDPAQYDFLENGGFDG